MDSMTPKDDPRLPRSRAQRHQTTEEWKRLVDRWLESEGKDRTWLAKKLGVPSSTVMRTLDPIEEGGSNTSSLVIPICELSGLPMPMTESWPDPQVVSLVEGFLELTDESKEALMKFVNLLRKGQGTKKGD